MVLVKCKYCYISPIDCITLGISSVFYSFWRKGYFSSPVISLSWRCTGWISAFDVSRSELLLFELTAFSSSFSTILISTLFSFAFRLARTSLKIYYLGVELYKKAGDLLLSAADSLIELLAICVLPSLNFVWMCIKRFRAFDFPVSSDSAWLKFKELIAWF